MGGGTRRSKYVQILGYLIFLFLVVEVFLLTLENQKLKKEIEKYSGGVIEPLKPGDKVESFKVVTLSGDTINFDYNDNDGKYLLFVFSTTCPHCERNLVQWNLIASSGQKDGNYIFGVSINDREQTLNYIRMKDVSFYTFTLLDTLFRQKYKISGVPTTILIKGQGKVEKVWIGELDSSKVNEIKSLMGA